MADPATLNSSAAWRSRGNALLSERRLEEARCAYEQAVAYGPSDAAALTSLGYAHFQLDAYAQAEQVLRRAVQLAPTDTDACYLLILTLQAQNRHEEVLLGLKDLVQKHPDFLRARLDLAQLLERTGQTDAALIEYEQAWSSDKSQQGVADGYLKCLLASGRWERVLVVLDETLALVSEAKLYRARALHALKALEEALALLEEILRIVPEQVFAMNGKAAVLISMGRHEEALQVSARVREMAPYSYDAWANAGAALGFLGRHEEALVFYEKAASVDPDAPAARVNLAQGLIQLQRCVDAQKVAQDGLEKKSGDYELRWKLAIASLLQGDFATGWSAHEARWFIAGRAKGLDPLVCSQPLWTGQDLAGKSLLLYHEQGFGDTLQMLRFVPLAACHAAKILLAVPEPLRELAQTSLEGGNVQVVGGMTVKSAAFDVHCPLMSLPRALAVSEQSIPRVVPYLRVPEEASLRWRQPLSGLRRPRVGLAWSGNPNHQNDVNRSIPLASLLPMLSESCDWVCLQKGVNAWDEQQLTSCGRIATYFADLESFSDTAALIDNVDLVISVDTSLAHLSGALGKPVWVLLPFIPDWRWMLGREDSPWYPTARLFRQDARREWAPVLDRVATELQAWLLRSPA